MICIFPTGCGSGIYFRDSYFISGFFHGLLFVTIRFISGFQSIRVSSRYSWLQSGIGLDALASNLSGKNLERKLVLVIHIVTFGIYRYFYSL